MGVGAVILPLMSLLSIRPALPPSQSQLANHASPSLRAWPSQSQLTNTSSQSGLTQPAHLLMTVCTTHLAIYWRLQAQPPFLLDQEHRVTTSGSTMHHT